MTSKGKEFYKTFKRSISGVSSNVNPFSSSSSSGQSTSTSSPSSGTKYSGGSGKTWIHAPDILINGRVEYSVKFVGTREVSKAQGADTVREALTAIKFNSEVKRAETGHSGAGLQKVDLQINVEGIIIVDSKTKMVLYRYPLQRISFCADDKQDKRVFAFIARAESDASRHDCFIFHSDKLAEQITLTVGEAFDLAYKRYLDKNKGNLESKKQLLLLTKRITELESENQVLSARLAEAIKNNSRGICTHCGNSQLTLLDTPALPSSPMPKGPPPGVVTSLSPFPGQANYSLPQTPSVRGGVPVLPQRNTVVADLHAPPTVQAPFVLTNGHQCGSSASSTTSASSPSGAPPSCPPPPLASSSHSGQSHPSSPTGVLAPPPQVAPRRHAPPKPASLADTVRPSFEGLSFPAPNDVFDDSFDPRAFEKNHADKDKEYDPFGDDFLEDVLRRGDEASRATAEDLQAMIDKVDKKLADMSAGFSNGKLETGQMDVGGGGSPVDEDLDDSGEYGVPTERVNADVFQTAAGSSGGAAASSSVVNPVHSDLPQSSSNVNGTKSETSDV